LVAARSLVELLRVAVSVLGEGDSAAVVSDEAEVSPVEAARLLDISRQCVDRLIA
jgi:hypothetical protein